MNALLIHRVLTSDGPGTRVTAGAAIRSTQRETSNDFEPDSNGGVRVVL
jgi:hypothetical protein